jgi:hypothetical protein
MRVWPYFCEEQREGLTALGGVTGTTPTALTIVGQRFEVSSWREVAERTIEVFADLDPSGVERMAAEFPRFVGTDPSRFRSPRELRNGLFMEANHSAAAIQRFCVGVTEGAKLSPDDWQVEYTVR